MSANASDTAQTAAAGDVIIVPVDSTETQPDVPLQITNAQTVCNRKNEKGKLCNGHLKQLRTGGEDAEKHLRGDDVLFKCQSCGTLYMGPPLGHVRDPDKQKRFVEQELAAILQAAGGSLPAFKMSDRGTLVPVDEPATHAATTSAKPAATTAAKPAPAATDTGETPEAKKARLIAEAAARKAATGDAANAPAETAATTKPAAPKASVPKTSLGPIPGADGPVPGETPEQKIARLKAVVAEAKRRKEALESSSADTADEAAPDAPPAKPVGRTTPTAASTSGTDSSAAADAHRPAAEAQAATGVASAAPLSPAAATASPVAGAEVPAELAPDSLAEANATTTAASPATEPAAKTSLGPIPGADGPVPGETHEQKIARLKAVVAEAKRRAELAGRVK